MHLGLRAITVLVCLAVLVPSAADADSWSDDFSDGDFTNNPSWTESNSDDVPGIVEVTGDEHYVRFFRDAPGGNGGNIALEQDVSLFVDKSSTITFDVNPVYSNVVGGAGGGNGEYPVEIRLFLRDQEQNHLQLLFCYNYRGGASLYQDDFIRVAFPHCEQNVWIRDESFRIRDYFPQAVLIEKIELAARGWDFEGCVDNLALHGVVLRRTDVPFFEQDLYIDITQPSQGGVYPQCAPDTVVWESNIPAWQGSPDVLDLYWRECGGSWQWFADDNNDGAHPWTSAPCDSGCYQVKVQYSLEPDVLDTVEFEVVGPEESLYVNIESPAGGGDYSPCAPNVITWDSNVGHGEGDVLALYWRSCGDAWHLIANSSNDGTEPWPTAPCVTGCYQLRIVYGPDPGVNDVVEFDVDGEDPPPPPPPGDPDFMMYVDFSGDAQSFYDVESRIDPTPFTTVRAYIGVSRLGSGPDGLTVVSFRLNNLIAGCPGIVATQSFTNLLPGNLAIGDPFGATGVTIASTQCMSLSYTGVLYVGHADFFYLGGACDVLILDHAEYPRWVVDCETPGEASPYCVWSHGGIAKNPVSGDQGCYPNTAVEPKSWGAIKAMYR